MSKYTVYWIAGLSNGEVATEGKGMFEEKNGELSPWLKLQEYLNEEALEIRSLRIRVDTDKGFREYHLPSMVDGVPEQYNYFRRVHGVISGGSAELVPEETTIFVEAIYYKQAFKVQLYTKENNPDQVWTQVVDIE